MAAAILGCGIDPSKCVLFRQSHVPNHTELSWILSCVATPGQMDRMTQYKDKTSTNDSAVNMGLYSYPILQAADILLYKADLVPVGHDQWQHIELCRVLAQRLNNVMAVDAAPVAEGEGDNANAFFNAPETLTLEVNARVKSLVDGSSKMSKSAPQERSRINLTDTADEITKKIRKAKTDLEPLLAYEPESRLEVANLLEL